MARVRHEPTFVNTVLHRSADDPALFMLHETWLDQEDFIQRADAAALPCGVRNAAPGLAPHAVNHLGINGSDLPAAVAWCVRSGLVGIVVGVLYGVLGMSFPALPFVALVGLPGMLDGEQVGKRLITWYAPSSAGAAGSAQPRAAQARSPGNQDAR